MKEWKYWQSMYNKAVTDHSDAGHKHKRVMSDELVDNAIFYLQGASRLRYLSC